MGQMVVALICIHFDAVVVIIFKWVVPMLGSILTSKKND
jgi:hypothetical protein